MSQDYSIIRIAVYGARTRVWHITIAGIIGYFAYIIACGTEPAHRLEAQVFGPFLCLITTWLLLRYFEARGSFVCITKNALIIPPTLTVNRREIIVPREEIVEVKLIFRLHKRGHRIRPILEALRITLTNARPITLNILSVNPEAVAEGIQKQMDIIAGKETHFFSNMAAKGIIAGIIILAFSAYIYFALR